jgi:CBS domain-containing protein
MLSVREIMATGTVTIRADSDLRQAIDTLLRHRVSGAPVVANGEVVGVVSATDVLQFLRATPPVAEQGPRAVALWEEGGATPGAYFVESWAGDPTAASAWFRELVEPDRLRRHLVTEVMSRSLCAVSPDAAITSAADYLLRAGVHRVLVLEAGGLVGILSTTDIVRAVAQGRLGPALVTAGT